MKKLLSIVAVSVLGLGLIGGAFAYWDSLQVTNSESTITVGEGQSITETIDLSAVTGKTLVPATAVLGADDVASAEFTYTVTAAKQTSADLTLTAVYSNVLIGGDGTYASLVHVSISYDAQTLNADDDVIVTITVTLDEPADSTAYAAVAGQDITFDMTFTAA